MRGPDAVGEPDAGVAHAHARGLEPRRQAGQRGRRVERDRGLGPQHPSRARSHGRTKPASWLPGTTTTSAALPSRAPSARSTGSATSMASRGRPSSSFHDVTQQHQPLDPVQRGEQRLERLGAAQDVAPEPGAEVEVGDDERGHCGRDDATRGGRAPNVGPTPCRRGKTDVRRAARGRADRRSAVLRPGGSLTTVRDMRDEAIGAVDDAAIRQVRAFNRSVTQRIGALNDEYLARGRPLGASRVLWEIGADGSDLRSARAPRPRLGLPEPSGPVARSATGSSRCSRARATSACGPCGSPRRARRARRCSTAAATSSPLAARSAQRRPARRGWSRRWGSSSACSRRASSTSTSRTPTSTAARFCIESYFAELDARFDAGFDPGAEHLGRRRRAHRARRTAPGRPPRGEPIGCGALKLHGASRPRSSACGWRRAPAASASGGASSSELEEHARRNAAPSACGWRRTGR